MAEISQAAMNAALAHFHAEDQRLKTQHSSAWEAFLTGRCLLADGVSNPGVGDANAAVTRLFTLDPSSDRGRLKPFRFGWGSPKDSGRATVWNVTTRDRPTEAASLFVGGDIRQGLKSDAAELLVQMVPHLPSKEALSTVLVRDEVFADDAGWSEVHKVARDMLGMSSPEYDRITSDTPLDVEPLDDAKWTIQGMPAELRPTTTQRIQTKRVSTSSTPAATGASVEMVIEARTERMIRRAVAKYPFILLVGPPGSGKGTLVSWIAQEVKGHPESFGFPAGFDPDPMWKTPDESWSSFDLVGGLAPDKSGALTWAPGAILNAVASNRWLILDETNRADMDRIMGPLLTWLSGQEVEVGRGLEDDTTVTLGWNASSPESVVDGEAHLAGSSWRLIGTYNPQDAQRVFRFGLALSRRFVVIPIPAVNPEEFTELLRTAHPELGPELSQNVDAMYSAHFDDGHTLLGPAIFLRIAEYLLGDLDEELDPADLVAEAYLLNLGKYLSGYDDALLDSLGTRLVDGEGALTPEQWSWITEQLKTMR